VSALTIARVGIGLAAAVKALELWPLLARLAGDPDVVPMPLARWPRPSAAVVPWVAAAWAGLGVAVAAGKAVPVTGALLAVVVGYVLTLDQQTYSNHLYLLSLLAGLLALAHTDRHRAPALALLRWQLVVVYAFAAASKINADFLSGRVIAENLPAAFGALGADPVPTVLAAGAIVIEGFVAACLLRPRWRVAGVIAGVGLHVVFVLAVTQTIAMIAFAVICLSLYPLYFVSPSVEPRA
jgi:Vitamin K-dependent gamma-carboxylase